MPPFTELLPRAVPHHDGEDRDSWLDARRSLVTASELSALVTSDTSDDYKDTIMFGSPYNVYAMWYDKVLGYKEPFSEYALTRMESGRLRELDILASLGSVVPSKVLFRHPDCRVGATLDGYFEDSVVEIKSPEWFAPRKSPLLWVDRPPQKYVMQLAVQMFVVGASKGAIVAQSEKANKDETQLGGVTRVFTYRSSQFDFDLLRQEAAAFLALVDSGRFRHGHAGERKHERVEPLSVFEHRPPEPLVL